MTSERGERLARRCLGCISKCKIVSGHARTPLPGCKVESTTFFADHSSGVIERIWPCLYDAMSFFAFSRPAAETSSVLPKCQQLDWCSKARVNHKVPS